MPSFLCVLWDSELFQYLAPTVVGFLGAYGVGWSSD